ncbi:hypothetical protein [Pleionea sp. CnH1-48]|uniref:hypothetical protein n=1 Tax=Pleionea sp. CnH1-48 TaxID=2954494 RepID=UPI0020982626|nr:hypothetical protein [Pleionea sp. CnH1-48]MCO7226588.1 hypothetical protein [Pleionea sp. CnH1-48]
MAFGASYLYLESQVKLYPSYSYSNSELVNDIKHLLDKKGIPYSYQVDHLKRIWITPHVNDEDIYNDVLNEVKTRQESESS